MYKLEELAALVDLWQNEYFHRIWIFQELQLASVGSLLQSGHDLASFALLSVTVAAMMQKSTSVVVEPEQRQMADEINNIRAASTVRMQMLVGNLGSPWPCSILDDLKHLKCTDPRDRIYGLVVQFEAQRLGITNIDHNLTEKEVYRNFVQDYLKAYGRLDILSLCWMFEHNERMPSWVPDLSRPKPTARLPLMPHEFSYLENDHNPIHGGVLKTEGVLIGTIVNSCSLAIDSQTSDENTQDEILRACRVLGIDLHGDYPAGGSTVDNLVALLFATRVADLYEPPLDFRFNVKFKDLKEIANTLVAISESYKPSTKHQRRPLTRSSNNVLLPGRVIAILSSGHVGLVPTVSRSGDKLAFLISCGTPIVLRPNSHGQYQVVGEAIVAGFMNGEAFLGPLPQDIVLAQNRNTLNPMFRNIRTGAWYTNDPRLENVRSAYGWQIIDDGNDKEYMQWQHDQTGDTYWTHSFDPRLTSPEFAGRGVQIQKFDLI